MAELIPLKLLLIEDSDDDALMLEHELRDAGFDLNLRRVDSEAALNDALAEGGWQAVISDYRLPGFNGMRALELVRAWHADVPFMLLTGTVCDNIGVEVMQEGANDYLLKDNLSRLIPALKRELGEAELRRVSRINAAQYAAILDFNAHAIISVDENFNICLYNHGAEQTFGYRAEEMMGQSLHRLLPEGIGAQHDVHIRGFAASDQIHMSMNRSARVIRGRHKDGHTFPAEASVTRTTVDGQTTFTTILRDVTDRQELEDKLRRTNDELEIRVVERTRELEQAKADAERLAQAKSEFLANMSHEIRNPMNAVLGLAYVLSKMDLPNEAHDLARKIHTSGQSLLGLLNDILDFSKMEAGKAEIEHAPIYLGDIFDNLATIMAAVAKGKGIELSISPPPASASYLIGDSLRIGQILINLTSNAIKFTERGSVAVKVEVVEETEMEATLRFIVRDTGIGMDAATQERLFSAFTQADSSTTRRFGGTGLGLVISRRLVELMGGELRLESSPGLGSTFSFCLTFHKQTLAKVSMNALLALKILVADDNPIALEGLGATLRSVGWQPELFESGEALWQRLLEATDLQSPDTVLLLDWQMPGLDGLQIVGRVHSRLEDGHRPLSLIVTAHGASSLAEMPDAALVDGILTKPLGPSMLYNAIQRVRHRRLGLATVRDTSSEKRLAGLCLLVVDDSEINLEVASHIFADEGATISTASNGQEAIDRLLSQPQSINVVLMDVHMPVMDGLEATRHIRQNPAIAHLPILALTAGALKEQQDLVLAAGMNGFITKPFIVDKAIRQILEAARGSLSEAINAEVPSAPTDNLEEEPNATLVNSDRGQRVFKKRDAYVMYLNLFVEQYREILPSLIDPATAPGLLEHLAHKMRGSAGNLGLERVAATANRLEMFLSNGQDVMVDARCLHEDLLLTFQAIAEYVTLDEIEHPAMPVDTPGASLDVELLLPLFHRILSGLKNFDPKPAETGLTELRHHLPAKSVDAIASPLLAFQFAEAEQALRALAHELALSLEE